MFSTLKQKLLLGVYIFVLLSIPMGTYLVSQTQILKSRASELKSSPKPQMQYPPKPSTPPAKQLLNSSQAAVTSGQVTATATEENASASPSPSPSSPTVATSFGPTLSFKINIEGRSAGNQATRVFVGITDSNLTSNPKFLLTFTVDVPASGQYTGLSLAGLNPGSQYTALLKGAAQIATSSAFTMSPAETKLNSGEPVNMISGDLNDDNVVNSADYSIAQKAVGSTSGSASWNDNADFNRDGLINTLDLSFISKNMGQTGASGAWTSPIPKVASSSASLTTSPQVGGLPDGSRGYWIWVPTP